MTPPTITIPHGPTQGVPTRSQRPLGAVCSGDQLRAMPNSLQAPKMVSALVSKRALALCGIAFNSQREPLAVGMAVNADVPPLAQTSGDGWLLLAPYGETAYWQSEGGQLKKYAQIFQRDQAQKMVSAFNAARMKRGTNFRGLSIYAGHPDVDPQRWPDERRRGSVQAMDARADGLYVKAAWNDLGQQNLAQGYLVYPSPAWLHNDRDAKQTGRIVPDELRSVGLTNSPRIADVDAWTNSAPVLRPAGQITLDLSTAAHRRTAYNARLDALMAEERLTFGQATNAMRHDALGQQILAAMNSAGSGQPFPQAITATPSTGNLSTPSGRSAAYNRRLDALMNARQLTTEQAHRDMRDDPAGKLILAAMDRASRPAAGGK